MGAVHLSGTASDLEEFARLFPDGLAWDEPSPGENRATWASEVLTGRATSVELRSGIQMMTTNVVGLAPLELDIVHGPRELTFAVNRIGIGDCVGPDGGRLPMSSGEAQASSVRETTQFRCVAPRGAQDVAVHLSIAPEALCELLGTRELPPGLRSLVEGKSPFSATGRPMSGALYGVLDDIMDCTMTGPLRRLYLESKGLELIALLADQFAVDERESEYSPEEIARLCRAREILLATLDSPPTLSELARQVGLNDRKLKTGFKALFGTPVFQYLRRSRMERAHELLRRGRHNVTEVAQAVGYANASKFAAAFRREFGLSPSAL